MTLPLSTLLFALAIGVLTAAATAARSVSWIWLRQWAEREVQGSGEAVPAVFERPQAYWLAAGTVIASLAFALGATLGFAADRVTLVPQLLVALVVVLLVGQVGPRMVARRWAIAIIPAALPLLRAMDAIVGPILAFVARRVRPPMAATADAPTPLEDLLREVQVEGIGDRHEVEIISDVVEFGDKRVRDVMTPRAQVTVVHEDQGAAEIGAVVAQSKFTRIPVVGRRADDVVGIVNAFDVLARPDAPLTQLRPAASATMDETCGAVMRRLLRERRHLAVVRDAAGAFVGIVTLEDLLEELVGDIRDEHDEPVGPA